jgi:hypothetical protein
MSRGRPLYTIAALGTMAALIALARLHTFYEPMERDITVYAVTGHEMLHGRQLYAQVWENKPPGVHVTYALAEWMAGYGYGQIYLLGVAAAVVTLAGVFAAGRAMGGRGAGLWAAAFWTIVCGDMILQANQPNAEVFINACMIWAMALLLVPPEGRVSYRRAVLAGLLFGVASAYKQVVIPTAALVAVVHVCARGGGAKGIGRNAAQVALMAAMGAAVWAVIFAVFAAGHRYRSFYEAVVVFNSSRAGSLVGNMLAAFTPRRAAPALLAGLLIVGVGVLSRRAGIPRRTIALLAAWGAGTFVAVALPGKFYAHYFQLWLPLVVVTAGVIVACVSRYSLRRGPLVWRLAGAALVAALLAVELPNYRLSPAQWSIRKYGHDVFVESQRAGRQLAGLLGAQERFYNWGAEPGLYFGSRRRPPSGIFFNFPIKDPRTAAATTRQLLAELSARPPELVVMHEGYEGDWREAKYPVIQWLRDRYAPLQVPGFSSQFRLYALRGSDAERRLSTPGVTAGR